MARLTRAESYGASQIGPFDYVPRLGFREYWYPAIELKHVGKNPIHLKLLGDDIVFFRAKNNKITALVDWCPHRGARLSLGVVDFEGTITCPYHGYVFDGTGQCVAGLIESPNSTFVPKLRATHYPTQELFGIVFIWMGATSPVPLEEDIPEELLDPGTTGRRFMRVKEWPVNWTEPVAQGTDFHEFYLHRGLTFWRLFSKNLRFFRSKMVYTGGVEIVDKGEDYVSTRSVGPQFGQAYYPGVAGKWPRHTWWRRLPGGIERHRGKFWRDFHHNVQLPSIARVVLGQSMHLRWGVPVDENTTKVWSFTLVDKPRNILAWLIQSIWYYGHRRHDIVVATNEKEDLFIFRDHRLNFETPEKLGPLDVGVIYWRRELALRARDYQRLREVKGTQKNPPRARSRTQSG